MWAVQRDGTFQKKRRQNRGGGYREENQKRVDWMTVNGMEHIPCPRYLCQGSCSPPPHYTVRNVLKIVQFPNLTHL